MKLASTGRAASVGHAVFEILEDAGGERGLDSRVIESASDAVIFFSK